MATVKIIFSKTSVCLSIIGLLVLSLSFCFILSYVGNSGDTLLNCNLSAFGNSEFRPIPPIPGQFRGGPIPGTPYLIAIFPL
jgi:hypothetical protein